MPVSSDTGSERRAGFLLSMKKSKSIKLPVLTRSDLETRINDFPCGKCGDETDLLMLSCPNCEFEGGPVPVWAEYWKDSHVLKLVCTECNKTVHEVLIGDPISRS